jgi:gluconate 2-dehydrogenase gamma chain
MEEEGSMTSNTGIERRHVTSAQNTGSENRNVVGRRAALKVLAATPFATSLLWTEPEIDQAAQRAEAVILSGAVHEPSFFSMAEWRTVRLLSDLIIPRDARSGSATDVGVPEFIDFMMIDQPHRQEPMRKGLTWLDAETQRRYGKRFVDSAAAQQAALLDELAWPKMAPAALKDGVDFFVSFRNYVMTGFFTSKVGVDDLQYIGNTFVPEWNGCPPAAMSKLGVSYHE